MCYGRVMLKTRYMSVKITDKSCPGQPVLLGYHGILNAAAFLNICSQLVLRWVTRSSLHL